MTPTRAAFVVGAVLVLNACGGGSGVAGGQEVKPDSSAIRYVGRFDQSNPLEPRISWAGSSISMRFTGTSVAMNLRSFSGGMDEYGDPKRDRYEVTVDGQVTELGTDPDAAHYVLAEGLRDGTHEVTIFKQTEPWIGDGKFLGFEIDASSEASAPENQARRIEFIGDDVLVGLGIEGTDPSCDYSARFQNHAPTFATLTSRSLGAEHTAIALSGVGVSRNFSDGFIALLGDVYARTFPKDPEPAWTFSAWIPQAVVLNAGASDFLHGNPGKEAFTSHYGALLDTVRGAYPDAMVVVTFGPMLSDSFPPGAGALSSTRAWLQEVVSARQNAGDNRIELHEFPYDTGSRGYGCDYHPNRETHRVMADELSGLLKQELGW
jgi:hypothetical protein